MFAPTVGQDLVIEGSRYRFAEHPGAPGMPYGQEGRQAVVYLLEGEDGTHHALKVFKPRYRMPALVSLSVALKGFTSLPGLQVCRRAILTPRDHEELLSRLPDLTYAALMPWITGPTWMQVVLDKRELGREESLRLARSLTNVLMGLEEQSIAHCDLSGSNVMLPSLAIEERWEGSAIELVDVEQIYAPSLPKSQFVSSGSPGYAHPRVPAGFWGPSADRFAGAILVAEILGWCNKRIRTTAWGDSYFDPSELQTDCSHYSQLRRTLQALWGERVAVLLSQAWKADRLEDCPTFGEWLVALPRVASDGELGDLDAALARIDLQAGVSMGSEALEREGAPQDQAQGIPPRYRQTPEELAAAALDRPSAGAEGPAGTQESDRMSWGEELARAGLRRRPARRSSPKRRAGRSWTPYAGSLALLFCAAGLALRSPVILFPGALLALVTVLSALGQRASARRPRGL